MRKWDDSRLMPCFSVICSVPVSAGQSRYWEHFLRDEGLRIGFFKAALNLLKKCPWLTWKGQRAPIPWFTSPIPTNAEAGSLTLNPSLPWGWQEPEPSPRKQKAGLWTGTLTSRPNACLPHVFAWGMLGWFVAVGSILVVYVFGGHRPSFLLHVERQCLDLRWVSVGLRQRLPLVEFDARDGDNLRSRLIQRNFHADDSVSKMRFVKSETFHHRCQVVKLWESKK